MLGFFKRKDKGKGDLFTLCGKCDTTYGGS